MDENTSLPEIEETLRRQLAAFSLSGEISRVIGSASSLDSVLDTLCLGLVEMLGFERVAVLGIQGTSFSLWPMRVAGMDLEQFAQTSLSLDFLAGEYSDAVFRNQHIIVDPVPDYDAFFALGSRSYAAFPIHGRVSLRSPLEEGIPSDCACAQESVPFCWTEDTHNAKSGLTEDERRRACALCPQFRTLGILWIDLTGRAMITADQVSMVISVAAQAGMAMENFRMHDSLRESNQQLSGANAALREANRLIQRDLRQANGIQKRLLPAVFPERIADVCAHYVPHSEIGGDYYDCFEIDENRLGLVVADVSGHGVTAALVMSMFKMLLKSGCREWEGPAQSLEAINATFLRELNSDQFVTVFYGIFHRGERTLTWTSAGHDPILLQDRLTGQVRELHSTGLFVGVFDDIKAKNKVEHLGDPARILLYTDGIPEAHNAQSEMFSLERLSGILYSTHEQRGPGATCRQLVDNILAELDTFTGEVPLKDDITLLACDL